MDRTSRIRSIRRCEPSKNGRGDSQQPLLTTEGSQTRALFIFLDPKT